MEIMQKTTIDCPHCNATGNDPKYYDGSDDNLEVDCILCEGDGIVDLEQAVQFFRTEHAIEQEILEELVNFKGSSEEFQAIVNGDESFADHVKGYKRGATCPICEGIGVDDPEIDPANVCVICLGTGEVSETFAIKYSDIRPSTTKLYKPDQEYEPSAEDIKDFNARYPVIPENTFKINELTAEAIFTLNPCGDVLYNKPVFNATQNNNKQRADYSIFRRRR